MLDTPFSIRTGHTLKQFRGISILLLLGGIITGPSWAGSEAWTALGPKGKVAALAADPKNADTLYAGMSGGAINISTDGGKNWKAVNLEGSFNILALVIDPQNAGTVYAGTGAGVYKSRDGGKTWTLSNTGLTNRTVQALAIDPNNPATLYAGTWGDGVFKNSQREIHWTGTQTGLKLPFIYTLAVSAKTPRSVYAGTYSSGVIKSIDGGATWISGEASTGISATVVPALVIDTRNSDTVYAGTNDWVPGKGYSGSVFKSKDGGKTWTAAGSGLPPKQLHALAMNPKDGNILYAGTEVGVFKTTDAGRTWTEMNSGLKSTDVYSLAVSPQKPDRLFAGTADGVFEISFGSE